MKIDPELRAPHRPERIKKRKPQRAEHIKKRKSMPLLMKVFTGFIILCFCSAGGVGFIFWEYGRDLPEYSQLRKYEPAVLSRVYANDGALLAEYAKEQRVFVPTKDIPELLINAFLSAEDNSFYNHIGVDPLALMRAALTNIRNYGEGRRPIGASTITQQVAKNFLLNNDLSIDRKIKEAILAIRMERAFSKDKLLALYLNDIYLGYGSYGVAAAALNYFDKSLSDLTLAEVAYLAALPKAPNNYHPKRKYEAAINRRNWVLRQMEKNGYITLDEMEEGISMPLVTRPQTGVDDADAPYFSEEVRRQMITDFGDRALYEGGLSIKTTLSPRLQAIADRALAEGLEALDKRQGWRGALGQFDGSATMEEILHTYGKEMLPGRYAAVVTKVTPKEARILVLQGEQGQMALSEGVIPFILADWAYPPRNKNGVRPRPIKSLNEALSENDIIMVQRPSAVPDRLARINKQGQAGEETAEIVFSDNAWALGQRPLVEGALVALDPHTGRVLAMVGGYNASDSEFNRATQAYRQPGSAFKPFVYLAALDNGFSPTMRILDAPLVVSQGEGQPKWKPANYTKRFYGPSIMRLGIEQSRNLMTARLAMAVGMDRVQNYAQRFGIDEDMPAWLSMSLGAGETTLMRLTAAYGMIVNGGYFIKPSLVDRVQDRYGATIFKQDDRPCGQCSFNDDEDVSNIIVPPPIRDTRDRITTSASAYQMVTMLEGVISRGTGRGIGNVGFPIAGKTGTTNENTNAWFVGFTPDLAVGVYVGYDIPRPLGENETGSTAAAPIFANFMRSALAGQTSTPFRRPEGINLYTINAWTGQRASAGDGDDTIVEAFKPGQRPLEAGEEVGVIDVPQSTDRSVVDSWLGLY